MLSQLINILYRHPKSRLKTYKRFGGYLNYCRMLDGQKAMQHASLSLPPVASSENGLPIYFLTGKNYLYQTLFCIHSIIKVTEAKFKFILIDDGTFDAHLIRQILNKLPNSIIITESIINQNINDLLPQHIYPQIYAKRKAYQHIKKLTDIHTLPYNSWKLVLDSDMLFWKEPIELINWLKKPDNILHMIDCKESYGYSQKLLENLCGTSVKSLINVGAIGLNSEQINWEKIEIWIGELEAREGASYFLEQALTAMLIGDRSTTILNSEEYIVNPTAQMIKNRTAKLHHYVDLSKESFFKNAWKHV